MVEIRGGWVLDRPRLCWMEGVKISLGQQNNGGRGCTSMHERLERVESTGTYVTE